MDGEGGGGGGGGTGGGCGGAGGTGRGCGGVGGFGARRAVDAVTVLKVSEFGGDGAVWDGWRKRMQRRILVVLRNSFWSCIIPGAFEGCRASKVSQMAVSIEYEAYIRLIGGARSPKGSSSHYMLCRKVLLQWLVQELDELVASAVVEASHVISPMCRYRNSLYC